MKNILSCLFFSAFVFAAHASAGTLTFEATDQGWYRDDGAHSTANTNTITGINSGSRFNSFYNFSLGTVPIGQKLVSAAISFNPGIGGYVSNDTSELLQLWDVSTVPGLGASTTIFADLMSGVKYGEITVFRPEIDALLNMPAITINLSSDAFADITQGGLFSIGAHVPTAMFGSADQALWSASNNGLVAASLTLKFEDSDVPEPSSLALLAVAVAGLAVARRKRTSTKSVPA